MYADKLAVLKTVKKNDDLKSLLEELTIYKSYLKAIPDGQEELGMGLLKIAIGTIDVFIRIGNTFKTNVSKFTDKLKRSEIKYYTESHRLLVTTLEKQAYAHFVSEKSYVPTGMVGAYIDAVNNISQIYSYLAITSIVKPVIERMDSLQSAIMNNDKDFSSSLSSLAHTVQNRQKLIVPAVSTNSKIFTNKKTPEKADFVKLYKTMDEFKSVRTKLTDLEEQLNITMNLATTLEEADDRLVSLVEFLNNTDNELVTKQFVTNLIDIVKFLGIAFDLQGNTSLQQMALEHNHVLNINALYKLI
jgi:hypothetical protein